MKVSRGEVLAYFCESYRQEYERLGDEGIAALLERGRRWKLSSLLREGGVLVFPHVHIADCGPYVAAVVDACLDSGSDRVLAIGVLHASTDEMEAAKVRVSTGQMRAHEEPLRKFYGPGLESESVDWTKDHGLYGFRRMLKDGARIRGIREPELVERYPFLVGEHPEDVLGFEEVAMLAKDAVVVSTADHVHHGIGYGHSPQEAMYYDEVGLAQVRTVIEEGLALLDAGRYAEYLTHCHHVAKSDWRDAGPVVHFLRGPLRSKVLALVPSDFSTSIYAAPAPTWAAGALVAATKSGRFGP